MKILCYTPSYNRLKMLRSCIQDVQTQTYKDIFHVVNITLDDVSQQEKIAYLFNDMDYKNLKMVYTQNNERNHTNYINTITTVDYNKYDLFVKIDDDDIYKKDYVLNIVNTFKNKNYDVLTSKVNTQLNGHTINRGNYNNLGGDQRLKMPMTLAFNKRALDIILKISPRGKLSDTLWRAEWIKNDMSFGLVENGENIVWYIHGQNISTANFLKK